MGFNGATAVRPWKGPVPRGQRPSRRQLQWGHGGEAVESGSAGVEHRRPDSFNGATAVRPWKDFLGCVDARDDAGLQWGHGGEAVESMPIAVILLRHSLLQWGHGGE